MQKLAADCSLKSFSISFLNKTLERSTGEEKTKMTATAPSNQRRRNFKTSELFPDTFLLK